MYPLTLSPSYACTPDGECLDHILVQVVHAGNLLKCVVAKQHLKATKGLYITICAGKYVFTYMDEGPRGEGPFKN